MLLRAVTILVGPLCIAFFTLFVTFIKWLVRSIFQSLKLMSGFLWGFLSNYCFIHKKSTFAAKLRIITIRTILLYELFDIYYSAVNIKHRITFSLTFYFSFCCVTLHISPWTVMLHTTRYSLIMPQTIFGHICCFIHSYH
jgi:hypothetical protein